MEGGKLYLMEYTFRSGEYEQIVRRVIRATSLGKAEKTAHAYLKDYYGDSLEEQDGDRYIYHAGEVACQLDEVSEITPAQLAERLLI